ncbi:hypothetical protein TWF694_002635 [Orbilia ellipsospora]|uniref:Uncharacterized protein n=1 Tax=Orbilia ellipsospora TaxID=2528407 RepID=A0AAV9X3T0_9PEZI
MTKPGDLIHSWQERSANKKIRYCKQVHSASSSEYQMHILLHHARKLLKGAWLHMLGKEKMTGPIELATESSKPRGVQLHGRKHKDSILVFRPSIRPPLLFINSIFSNVQLCWAGWTHPI